MANWLDKALGRRSTTSVAIVPYERVCQCGLRLSGVRQKRARRVICPQCGAAHFILPANPYPVTERTHFAPAEAVPVAPDTVAPDTVRSEQSASADTGIDSEREESAPDGLPGEDVLPAPDDLPELNGPSAPDETGEADDLPLLDDSLDLEESPRPVESPDSGESALPDQPLRFDDSLQFDEPLDGDDSPGLDDPPPLPGKDADSEDVSGSASQGSESEGSDSEIDIVEAAWAPDEAQAEEPLRLDDEPAGGFYTGSLYSKVNDRDAGAGKDVGRDYELAADEDDQDQDQEPDAEPEPDAEIAPEPAVRRPRKRTGESHAARERTAQKRKKSSSRKRNSAGPAASAGPEEDDQARPGQQNDDDAGREAQLTVPSVSENRREQRGRIVAVSGLIVAVLTLMIAWTIHSRQVRQAEATWRDSRDAGIAALNERDFVTARKKLRETVEAMELLELDQTQLEATRRFWLQAEAGVGLLNSTDVVEVALAAEETLREGDQEDWDRRFHAQFKDRWLVMQLSDFKTLKATDTDDGPIGRRVVFPALPVVHLSGLNAVLEDSEGSGDRLWFAGPLESCRRDPTSPQAWLVDFDDSRVFECDGTESLVRPMLTEAELDAIRQTRTADSGTGTNGTGTNGSDTNGSDTENLNADGADG